MLGCSLKIASGASMQRSLATAGVAIAPRSIDLLQRRNVSVSAAAFENDPGTPRTFAQFAIYKGKAAVAFKPITPGFKQSTFNNATYGAYNGYALEKEGVLLLEFASVLPSQGGQTGYGNRNYDWSKKVTFALKAVELAALTDLDNSDATKGVEFFHDPNKGSSNPNAVKTMKTLKISLPQGSDVYMLSINQSAGTQKSYITVPITRAEYVTLKHLAAYMIPRMFGFDLLFEGQGSVPSNVLPPEPQA